MNTKKNLNRRKANAMKFFAMVFLIVSCCLKLSAQDKPAVIVLTDIGGDTDDQQSLVRFLLYSDMFDVKAICATSRMGHGNDTRPDIIQNQINAYKKVYPNLLLHSKNYPSPDDLSSIIKKGSPDESKFGEGYDTEASDFIIKKIDGAKNTVHIAIWGGQRELAQALWKLLHTRSKSELGNFCKKIQVHAIGDQDNHRDWIITNFKDIRYIADGFVNSGDFKVRQISAYRGMYMTGDTSQQSGDWVKKNIHGHGTLGDSYPLDGHGTDGMKEGDSPAFLGLIANGLNAPKHPGWGGWGGRFRLLNNNLFVDAQDFLDGTLNERHTVARWRTAFQNDFMARINWCVEPYARANHNPIVKVNNSSGHSPLIISAQIGEKLTFDASGSQDPDGNDLSFNWFFYREINDLECLPMELSVGGKKCEFTVPENTVGRNVHLILEVKDKEIPSLTKYKRIIIDVLEKEK